MKDEKKRASAKARAEKALRPKRKPGRPPKKPQTPDGPRPKSKAKAAPKTAALDPATKKSKALKSKKGDAPPPPKKSKKAGEKVVMKTPEKPIVPVRGWSPSPLAVQGAPSEKKRDERMVKALAALHELLAAMSSDPSPKDFHGPEAGFAKKILIKIIINGSSNKFVVVYVDMM